MVNLLNSCCCVPNLKSVFIHYLSPAEVAIEDRFFGRHLSDPMIAQCLLCSGLRFDEVGVQKRGLNIETAFFRPNCQNTSFVTNICLHLCLSRHSTAFCPHISATQLVSPVSSACIGSPKPLAKKIQRFTITALLPLVPVHFLSNVTYYRLTQRCKHSTDCQPLLSVG